MTIAFDATTATDASGKAGAGVEHYTWSMLLSMARAATGHKLLVIARPQLSKKREAVLRTFANVEILKLRSRKYPLVTRHAMLPLKLKRKKADVLFAPSGQVPLGWFGPSVITVHDVSIFTHPEWFPDSAQSISVNMTVPRSIARADRILTVSEATERALVREFPDAEEKTRVVYPGVEAPSQIPTPSSSIASLLSGVEDVLLYVGTIEPRKNLLAALHAFHAFLENKRSRASMTRFVIAGKVGWKAGEVEEAIADLNRVWRKAAGADVVIAIGYVSERDKWALLDRAGALILVSHEEGFGLPVLEAMAIGTPAIVSGADAFREVGGEAVVYVDPEDAEATALTIAQCLLVPDMTAQLRADAKERAERFSWARAGEQAVEEIEKAYQQSKDPRS